MTAAALHLIVVHLPVVACPLTLLLLLVAHQQRSDLLFKLGYSSIIGCAVAAAVAYYSGPEAYEQLEEILVTHKSWVEQHAVIARAAFVVLIINAVLAIQALLQFAQDEPPARWLRWLIAIFLLAVCYLLAWSAHLGGEIRHTEIRQLEWLIFPRLDG